MKVFIADESVVVRERLTELLSVLPEIEVIDHAEEGRKATSSIRKINPDVVILDIRITGGGGIDLLKSIKKNKPTPAVIVLTNTYYPTYREKCLSAGADFFFDKSMEFEKMIEVLKKMISVSKT